MKRLSSLYGSSPLHLIGHLVSLLIAGIALLLLLDVKPLLYVLGWLLGAVILHDFVLLPLYGVLDRIGRIGLRGAINYVRVPIALSGLLLLVYFPVILGNGEPVYSNVSATSYDGSDYLGRWALTSAVLFLAAALLYGVRVARARSGSRSAGSTS